MKDTIASLKKRIEALERSNPTRRESTDEPALPECPLREDWKCIGVKCVGWTGISKVTFSLLKGGRTETRGCCIITRLSCILGEGLSLEAREKLFNILGGDPAEEETPNGLETRPNDNA